AVGLVGTLGGGRAPLVADVDRWAFLLTLVAFCAVMLGKARRPLLCLGAGLAVFGVDVALGGSAGVTIALRDLIFSAAPRVSARALRRLGGGVVVCVVGGAAATFGATGARRGTGNIALL